MQGEQFFAAHELFPVDKLELFHLMVLAREGFYHPHPAQVLLQCGGKDGILFLVGFVSFGDFVKEKNGDCHDKRHHDDGKPGQFDIQVQQGGKVDQEQQDDAPYANRLVVIKTADGIHIRGTALNEFPGAGFRVVGEGEVLDMVE